MSAVDELLKGPPVNAQIDNEQDNVNESETQTPYAPPSYQQHLEERKYNVAPTAPMMSEPELPDICFDADIDKPDNTTSLIPSTTETNSKFSRFRQQSMRKIGTFRQQSTRRINTGFDNIAAGPSYFGLVEVMLLALVIYTVVCIATPIYSIYAGSLLNNVWSEYDKERINIDCNGHYDAFTYKVWISSDSNRHSSGHYNKREIGSKFIELIVLGSIQSALICLGFLWILYRRYVPGETPKVIGTWFAFGLFGFGFLYFDAYIKCIRYRNNVLSYCDSDTLIYTRSTDMFPWFFPLCIFELTKCVGIPLCIFLVACASKVFK